MAQTLQTWFDNSRVRRGALKDVLPLEDQPDDLDMDHPSAYETLTGGSQRRCGKRLPACPTREDPSAYDVVNGVEDQMLAILDGDVAAKEDAELDEDVVWNPGAMDLTELAKAERKSEVEVKMTASDAWAAIEKGQAVLVGFADGEPVIKMKPVLLKKPAPRKPAPRRQPQRAQPAKAAAAKPKQAPRQATASAATAPRTPDEPPCPLDWSRLVLPDIIPRN